MREVVERYLEIMSRPGPRRARDCSPPTSSSGCRSRPSRCRSAPRARTTVLEVFAGLPSTDQPAALPRHRARAAGRGGRVRRRVPQRLHDAPHRRALPEPLHRAVHRPRRGDRRVRRVLRPRRVPGSARQAGSKGAPHEHRHRRPLLRAGLHRRPLGRTRPATGRSTSSPRSPRRSSRRSRRRRRPTSTPPSPRPAGLRRRARGRAWRRPSVQRRCRASLTRSRRGSPAWRPPSREEIGAPVAVSQAFHANATAMWADAATLHERVPFEERRDVGRRRGRDRARARRRRRRRRSRGTARSPPRR